MNEGRLLRRRQSRLRQIAFYIAEDDYPQAMRFTADLCEACRALASFPRRYPVWSGVRSAAIRRRTYHRYGIYYRVAEDDDVVILRIVHGSRELDDESFTPAGRS